jgi:hypothetical protein
VCVCEGGCVCARACARGGGWVGLGGGTEGGVGDVCLVSGKFSSKPLPPIVKIIRLIYPFLLPT